MLIGQFKRGFSSIVVIFFAVNLLGCAQENIYKNSRIQWAFDVVQDQCIVLEIIKDYFEKGEGSNGHSYSLDFFRRDRDSILRARYKGRDWNILDYVIQDQRYDIYNGCKSDFSQEEIYNGVRNGNLIKYHFRSRSGGILCRLTPPPAKDVDENPAGLVQSCIDVNTGMKTFDVIHND